MATIEALREKACALSSSDRIGHAFVRVFDVIGAVERDGIGAESVSELIELLTNDRVFAMKHEHNITPLRALIYGLIEYFGSMVEDIANKRIEEILKMGQMPSIACGKIQENTGLSEDSNPLFSDDFVKVEEPDDFIEMNDASLGGEEPVMKTEELESATQEIFGEPGASYQSAHQHIQLLGSQFRPDEVVKSEDGESSFIDSTINSEIKEEYSQVSSSMDKMISRNSPRKKRKGGPAKPGTFTCEVCAYTCYSSSALKVHM
ncbi:hypothetical protein PENTCL1PPCAC_25728, partial [Pristionchus entomophagus]